MGVPSRAVETDLTVSHKRGQLSTNSAPWAPACLAGSSLGLGSRPQHPQLVVITTATPTGRLGKARGVAVHVLPSGDRPPPPRPGPSVLEVGLSGAALS